MDVVLVRVLQSSRHEHREDTDYRQRVKDPGAVFIAGATGQVGIRIAQILLCEGYSERAGVSNLGAAQKLACLSISNKIKRSFHHAIVVGRQFPICRVHVNGFTVEVSSFGTAAKQTRKREKHFVPKMTKEFHQKDFIIWKDSMHRYSTVNNCPK
ncbi:uncharacterized protein LOC107838811 isoform X2 [Capsicum annuum]|uniref:uncharacterized protein LOC107838811 isoform X2 n=1 Tax=Capsicum annuum TaxID=4072 RepID=UPI001FB0F3A9|nr:uncharacterized protein LOC107838811 isoform X2 [Capsicum annuum]